MTTARKSGEIIGNFQIIRELGAGGMGIVYEAFDTTLERHIALKIIKPSDHYSEDKLNAATKRFQREAKLAARVNHPNLVTVHSLDAVGDVLLLAMEWSMESHWTTCWQRKTMGSANGRTNPFRDSGWSRRGTRSWNCPSRSKARQRHDDAKRSPKVLDFGVAGRLDGKTPIDGTGVPQYGTISYMAPEQVTRGSIGPWTDVFAIGAIGYELVTGIPAFGRGDPVTVGMRVTSESPPLLTDSTLAEEQFGTLTAVLDRALHKKHRKRFKNARALADALQPIVESSFAAPGQRAPSPSARLRVGRTRTTYPPAIVALQRWWKSNGAPVTRRIRYAVNPWIDRIAKPLFQNTLMRRLLPDRGLPVAVTRRITVLGAGLLLAFGMTTLAAVARAGRADFPDISSSPIHVVPSRAEITVVGPPRHDLVGTNVTAASWDRLAGDSVLLRFSTEGFLASEAWFTGSPIYVELEPSPKQLCGVVRADPPGTRITTDDPAQAANVTSSVLCVRNDDSLLVTLTSPGYATRTVWFKGPDVRVALETRRIPVRFESNRDATVSVLTMNAQPIVTARRTPFSAPITPGSYRVRFQVEGLPPHDSVYTIEPSATSYRIRQPFAVETTATTGVLRVWVENGWARVSVDGGPSRLTATTFANLDVGPHVLELSRPGGETRVDTVYVQPLATPTDTTRIGYTADLSRRLTR